MGMELLGIIASFATIVSGFGWLFERSSKRYEEAVKQTNHTITKVETKLENVDKCLQDLRVFLPTNFVTKQELAHHIEGEQHWHEKTSEQLHLIQEELFSLRYHGNNGHH